MTQELIEKLRDESIHVFDANEAADALEQQTAEIERLREENRQWKEGGYTSLWKQRTEDRDKTIEMQRCTLLNLRERIATLEAAMRKAITHLRPTLCGSEFYELINKALGEQETKDESN